MRGACGGQRWGRGATKNMWEGAAIEVEAPGRPADRGAGMLSRPARARDVGGASGNRGTEGAVGTVGESSSKCIEDSLGSEENGGGRGAEAEATGMISGAPNQDSWIQRTFQQVLKASQLRASLPDAQPVTVLRVERYMEEAAAHRPPAGSGGHSQSAPFPSCYYDVTVTDGTCQEKCHLAHELNPLVHKNTLRCGLGVKITQCSYMYHEKKLRYGFLCIEQLEVVGASDVGDSPQELKEYSEKPTTPLKGGKKHYLPLWNNEDPYGDIWVAKKLPQDVCVDGKFCNMRQMVDLGTDVEG